MCSKYSKCTRSCWCCSSILFPNYRHLPSAVCSELSLPSLRRMVFLRINVMRKRQALILTALRWPAHPFPRSSVILQKGRYTAWTTLDHSICRSLAGPCIIRTHLVAGILEVEQLLPCVAMLIVHTRWCCLTWESPKILGFSSNGCHLRGVYSTWATSLHGRQVNHLGNGCNNCLPFWNYNVSWLLCSECYWRVGQSNTNTKEFRCIRDWGWWVWA